ncbi:MAG: CtsR family transcriptional regulator [Halanaerobiaceae bacterium]
MVSLSDQIEQYFRKLLNRYQGEIEIKRNKLADEFDCAPSQINYVIDTRFSVDKGYLVESQRGGGGYIRIIKINIDSEAETIQNIISRLDKAVPQKQAESIIERLYENDLINEREKELMNVAVNRKIIQVDLPYRDYIRGRILKGMLKTILKNLGEEE